MIPAEVVELCKRFEGLHKIATLQPIVTVRPYICPAGYWTIGYGHVVPNREHPPITEPEAEDLLERDLAKFTAGALRLCPVLAGEPAARRAAIIDFAFNLGLGRLQTSTLRRRVLERDWPGAAEQLRRWVYGGGRVLPGLVARREVEAAMLVSGVATFAKAA